MFYWTCLLLMDVPSLNSLFLSVVPSLSALTVCSLKSSVLTVLSWLPPPPQHPLLLSPRCLSLPFYSFFACFFFFSHILPPSLFLNRAPTQPSSHFYFSFVWNFSMNVCRESRRGLRGGRVTMCTVCLLHYILICRAAAWGRLVLVAVCVCAIWRCRCLFLITFFKTSCIRCRCSSGNQQNTWGHISVFMCAFKWGVRNAHMCIYYGPPFTSCSPHCDKLGRGTIKAFLLSSFYGVKLAKQACSRLCQVPTLHSWEEKYQERGLSIYSTKPLKRSRW